MWTITAKDPTLGPASGSSFGELRGTRRVKTFVIVSDSAGYTGFQTGMRVSHIVGLPDTGTWTRDATNSKIGADVINFGGFVNGTHTIEIYE